MKTVTNAGYDDDDNDDLVLIADAASWLGDICKLKWVICECKQE